VVPEGNRWGPAEVGTVPAEDHAPSAKLPVFPAMLSFWPVAWLHVVLNRNAVPSCSPRVPSLGRALPGDSRVPPPPSRSQTATRSRHGRFGAAGTFG
jgi:hypothetical protein